MQQLEAQLADTSLAGQSPDAVIDIISHWQSQVASADERARQAAAEHAKENSALRQAHARYRFVSRTTRL
jgi:hypothetical protein